MEWGKSNLCGYCSKNIEGIPFKCSYCENWFCAEHRLPEKHNCENLKNQSKKKSKNYYNNVVNGSNIRVVECSEPQKKNKTKKSLLKRIFGSK